MNSTKLKKILSDEGPQTAKNELATLFRIVAKKHGVDEILWNYLLTRYVERFFPKLMGTKLGSYARGNLNQQLQLDTMTWKAFMDGVRFLNPDRVKLKVEFVWGSGENAETVSHDLNLRINGAHHPLPSEEPVKSKSARSKERVIHPSILTKPLKEP